MAECADVLVFGGPARPRASSVAVAAVAAVGHPGWLITTVGLDFDALHADLRFGMALWC